MEQFNCSFASDCKKTTNFSQLVKEFRFFCSSIYPTCLLLNFSQLRVFPLPSVSSRSFRYGGWSMKLVVVSWASWGRSSIKRVIERGHGLLGNGLPIGYWLRIS
ncbi:hypothetical protein CFOL_v3_03158 [Cephalotus follicularis]|uniref:Uncharacterized protein n=1 Tax=Cephalotus follicularis TaxID=3775 RepID=A0A1Q3AV61_CEPFO|nr:hypothetical protein CFOL_v3_03158 [Cephalotus follicularis]